MKTCTSCHVPQFSAIYREEMEEIICQPCYEKELKQKKTDDELSEIAKKPICKYCQTEILRDEDNGYCQGCRDAEKIERELRNFILWYTHENEDEAERDQNSLAYKMYEGVRCFMDEVYLSRSAIFWDENITEEQKTKWAKDQIKKSLQ